MKKGLDHPAYHREFRRRLWNVSFCALNTPGLKDAAWCLRKANAEWTKEDHLRLAEEHRLASASFLADYNRLLDEASQITFGRPYHISDYRICGIARDEYPREYKEKLWAAIRARQDHERCYLVHYFIATRGHRPQREAA